MEIEFFLEASRIEKKKKNMCVGVVLVVCLQGLKGGQSFLSIVWPNSFQGC